jgi:hypothetical protein
MQGSRQNRSSNKLGAMGAKHQSGNFSTTIHASDATAGEARRLLELRQLGLLDTAPEECFDRIARLAARTLQLPIALISLVDEDREWVKSCVGVLCGACNSPAAAPRRDGCRA